MLEFNKKPLIKRKLFEGRGLINSLINKLPFELHLPGYQYCGPGTKLVERLARGDPGINQLDQACRDHDIAYSKYKSTSDRNIADRILAGKAWSRAKSKDANLSERVNALLVTNIMNAKAKFGMGVIKNKKKASKKGKKSIKHIPFKTVISKARKAILAQKPNTLQKAIKLARKEVKDSIKNRKKNVNIPRVISVPKTGGVLPFLVPLFAGLSAIGALSGGAAHIAKAINAAKQAKEDLKESQRHNKTMESIAMGKGLFLKPYKKGLGLYLNPYTKNY